MQGRTWKNVNREIADEAKKYLLDTGGTEESVKSEHEVWKIKFSDATFTYYLKGTLFSTPSNAKDPAVIEAWKHIDALQGSAYALPTKDFLIGLDETGKGEVIGHTVLTGAAFPKEIFYNIDLLTGPADTKNRHEFSYWDSIFKNIDSLRNSGFDFITEKIPPWHVDKYNLNKIMDVTYQRILFIFFRKIEINRSRIVLDDYRIGPTLNRFLSFLKQQGAEVEVTSNAEDKYLEVKTASLISKRTREAIIKTINENPEFQINGLSIGSGNAGDKQTLAWLKRWANTGRVWPWFVKRSFKTIRQLEEKTGSFKKEIPPIREDLLSTDFLDSFSNGKLSIQALSLICPHCGAINKAIHFAVSKAKCPACNKFIDDVGITLRYYCGYIIPDSSVILRGTLSKDLKSEKFFENYTVVIPPVVLKERDTSPGGKAELGKLAKFASIGRIKLETPGKVEAVPDGLTSLERDERIINSVLEYNGICITADNTMKAQSVAKDIFTIFVS